MMTCCTSKLFLQCHRPITLLPPVLKILESLILPAFQETIQLADHQHGFRAGRCTTTALCKIVVQIANGLNMKRPNDRSILVALDLSKAFDMVSHDKLLDDVFNTTLSNQLKRWFLLHMTGRQSYVELRGAKFNKRLAKQGVPQGGVISPILFNLYVSNFPNLQIGAKLRI